MGLRDQKTAIFDMNEISVEYKMISTYSSIYTHVTGSKESQTTAKYRTESNIFGDNTPKMSKNDPKKVIFSKKMLNK